MRRLVRTPEISELRSLCAAAATLLEFPRRFAIVLPGAGDPTDDARALIERLKAAV